MELNRKAIEELRFKNKGGKFYYADEVDEALDMVAEAAEKQQQEINRLEQVEYEYLMEKARIGETLLAAKKITVQYVEQEKARYGSEIKNYEDKKRQLEQEIRKLEREKTEVIEGFKRDVSKLKMTIESFGAENVSVTNIPR